MYHIYGIVQYVSYVTCTDCESNIITLTSHSSFVYISIVACATMNGNLTVCNTLLITCGILKMASNVCGEVNEVREERLRWRRECDRLRREWETNEERQVRLVNFCRHLSLLSIHNLVMVLLTRRRANDGNRHAEQHEELREGVSPLILLYSVVL